MVGTEEIIKQLKQDAEFDIQNALRHLQQADDLEECLSWLSAAEEEIKLALSLARKVFFYKNREGA